MEYNLLDQNTIDRHRAYLSQKLIEAREKAGFTQKEVGKLGFITQSALSKIEGGKRRVDFTLLIRLSALYEQPIEFFFLKSKIEKK